MRSRSALAGCPAPLLKVSLASHTTNLKFDSAMKNNNRAIPRHRSPAFIADSATIVASYTANVIADAGADLITPGSRPL